MNARDKKKSQDVTFASNPARQAEYTYGDSNRQKKWLDQSEKVINQFLDKLEQNEFKSFSDAVSWMGQQRCLIAIHLGHGDFLIPWSHIDYDADAKQNINKIVAENLAWYTGQEFPEGFMLDGYLLYGKPRGFTTQFLKQEERVSDLDEKFVTGTNKEALFQSLQELVKVPFENNYFENNEFNCRRVEYTEGNDKYYEYKICYKFPETAESSAFVHPKIILEIQFTDLSKKKSACFIHPVVSEDEQVGTLKVLDTFWKTLIDWKPNQGTKIFFENMAKLAHLSACLPYFERGTSSAVEWVMHTVAYRKGIYLGPFTVGMGWDFRAFCTPDVAKYAQWLSNDAFNNITYFDINLLENRKCKFSYTKPPLLHDSMSIETQENALHAKDVLATAVLKEKEESSEQKSFASASDTPPTDESSIPVFHILHLISASVAFEIISLKNNTSESSFFHPTNQKVLEIEEALSQAKAYCSSPKVIMAFSSKNNREVIKSILDFKIPGKHSLNDLLPTLFTAVNKNISQNRKPR
jgi:hypothetical protein